MSVKYDIDWMKELMMSHIFALYQAQLLHTRIHTICELKYIQIAPQAATFSDSAFSRTVGIRNR